MKKKASGKFRARLNARGYEQVDGIHYKSDDIAAPVANDMTIRILDIVGAFLNGRFDNGEVMYMPVPQGFEKFYPKNVLLLLMRAVYGTKQAAMQYWRETQGAFKEMRHERSKADPCLYFRWVEGQLILWLTWVDDCLIVGKKNLVLSTKEQMKKLFDCDDLGEMTEYVCCKVERSHEKRYMKLTQPVMIQFKVSKMNSICQTRIQHQRSQWRQVKYYAKENFETCCQRRCKSYFALESVSCCI